MKYPLRRKCLSAADVPRYHEVDTNAAADREAIVIPELSPNGIAASVYGAVPPAAGSHCRQLELQELLVSPNAETVKTVDRKKELGAYYTSALVARFLLRWAVKSGKEIVLDPSSGEGVFLAAAAERIHHLGGNPRRQVYGVEIDAATCQRLASSSLRESIARLHHGDFFRVRVGDLPAADAVVGNPPFIRYQRFNGDARREALQRAREAGVELSRLTSSWAPFLVHAISFLRPGGRLAMVVPAELTHATYARPVLDYLRRCFGRIRLLCFARRLFSTLSEDTALLLAADRGEPLESFTLVDLQGVSSLDKYTNPESDLPTGVEVDALAVERGNGRLVHYLLPSRIRDLYRELRELAQVATLADLANVGIGYVTGDNNFFHLDQQTIDAYDIPSCFLRPAACSSNELDGLRFTHDDWLRLQRAGRANSLLYLSDERPLPLSLQAYLLQGTRRGVPNRYKCRVRKPWYRVPHVYDADGFLTYMSGSEPKLVANDAGAVAPNTLHVVRLLPTSRYSASALAAAWQTSLTALSCELEGHSLGGGMLKLEPKEARRVAVALADLDSRTLETLCFELDELVRANKADEARNRADAVILREGLGLSNTDIQQLREGWLVIKTRRLNR